MLGIFDSGIGGLTVVKAVKKVLPDRPIVYFGDTARYPWGNKSKNLIKKYSEEIVKFLKRQGAQEIIIACNTASTFAGKYLQKKFPEIEFHDAITPVVRKIALEKRKNKNHSPFNVAVIGTRGTIESGAYQKRIGKIDRQIKIYSESCPLFVPLAEENLQDHKIAKDLAEEYLGKFKNKKINFLVLGCTHYPLLKKVIQKTLGKKVILISSDEEIAKNLKDKREFKRKKGQKDIYYFSDIVPHYRKLAEDIIGEKIKIKKIVLK
jgi:glutamate racemase